MTAIRKVFVVDFVGFCLPDLALDVGYFLARLQADSGTDVPVCVSSLSLHAAETFVNTYGKTMLEHGLAQAIVDGILERSTLYEADLLFKVVTC